MQTAAPQLTEQQAGQIRNVTECPNLSNTYFEVWQSWQGVRNGKYIGLRSKITEQTLTTTTPEYWKQYPINWMKGTALIFEVQADYYQEEDDHGNKGGGHCRRLIYYTSVKHDAASIAAGRHPVNLGYKLLPIF